MALAGISIGSLAGGANTTDALTAGATAAAITGAGKIALYHFLEAAKFKTFPWKAGSDAVPKPDSPSGFPVEGANYSGATRSTLKQAQELFCAEGISLCSRIINRAPLGSATSAYHDVVVYHSPHTLGLSGLPSTLVNCGTMVPSFGFITVAALGTNPGIAAVSGYNASR